MVKKFTKQVSSFKKYAFLVFLNKLSINFVLNYRHPKVTLSGKYKCETNHFLIRNVAIDYASNHLFGIIFSVIWDVFKLSQNSSLMNSLSSCLKLQQRIYSSPNVSTASFKDSFRVRICCSHFLPDRKSPCFIFNLIFATCKFKAGKKINEHVSLILLSTHHCGISKYYLNSEYG